MTGPLRAPAASWVLVALLLTAPGAADAIEPGAAPDALRFPSNTPSRRAPRPLPLDKGEARLENESADAMSRHAAYGRLALDDKNQKVAVV